jgi:hypothetical protein
LFPSHDHQLTRQEILEKLNHFVSENKRLTENNQSIKFQLIAERQKQQEILKILNNQHTA